MNDWKSKFYKVKNLSMNRWAVSHDDKKWGIVDENGEIVAPIEYENIGPFFNGLSLVFKGEHYGYVSLEGKLVIPCTFDYANPFFEKITGVLKDFQGGFIDTKGRVVVPFIYSWFGSFYQGLCPVRRFKGKSGQKYSGVLNTEGKEVITTDYIKVNNIESSFFEVSKDGVNFGVLDARGVNKIVLSLKYDILKIGVSTIYTSGEPISFRNSEFDKSGKDRDDEDEEEI